MSQVWKPHALMAQAYLQSGQALNGKDSQLGLSVAMLDPLLLLAAVVAGW